MRRRVSKRLAVALAAFIAAFDTVALITGYVGVGWPVKGAGLIVALAGGAWLYRREKGHAALPTVAEVLVVALLATTVAFGLAWSHERPSKPTRFDFLVTPKHGYIAAESVAPGPGYDGGPWYRYGAHVAVTCVTLGSDKRLWYRLEDHNFLSMEDVHLAPLGKDLPPVCK
jgi:hypothetical protein